MIAYFGAGEIAERGMVPLLGGVLVPAAECDVTRPGEVRAALHRHRPDVVVFTAGVSFPQPVAGAGTAGTAMWRAEVGTNLLGAFNVASAALDFGVRTMVFVASVAGLYGKPRHAGYCASKAGLISLVQSLGMEGHDAYAVSPGRVDTSMRQRDYPGDRPGTRLDPSEVGQVVVDILAGRYRPGDNIVIRRVGYSTAPVVVDRGEPWRTDLRVGQPVTL